MDDLLDALELARNRKRLPSPAQRRRIRIRSGVTQTAVAAALDVSVAALSRWESGLRAPSGDRLNRYLAVLDQLAAEAEREP